MRGDVLVTDGSLRVQLAASREEVEAAQRLRYRIFCEEMGARLAAQCAVHGRDADRFDEACDHLLVLEPQGDAQEARVVGTYRMLRRSAAERCGGFYSEDEYDLGPLLKFPGEIMEVGRSCVDSGYRSRAVMQLLWQGIAAYVYRHKVGLLFGCASLPGTVPAAMRQPLAYLRHFHFAPAHIRPRAVAGRYVPMDEIPAEAVDTAAAWRELPPLIRGYLRLGGRVGDGAVIDHAFNTTDVCLMVETEQVTARYLRHYHRLGEQPQA